MKWQRWELDLLERERMKVPPTHYIDIGRMLNRSEDSVRGAASRLNLTRSGYQWQCHRKFTDEQEEKIAYIIQECIEVRGMVGHEIKQHLSNLGYEMGRTAVWERIHRMPHSIRCYYYGNLRAKKRNWAFRHHHRSRSRLRDANGRFTSKGVMTC